MDALLHHVVEGDHLARIEVGALPVQVILDGHVQRHVEELVGQPAQEHVQILLQGALVGNGALEFAHVVGDAAPRIFLSLPVGGKEPVAPGTYRRFDHADVLELVGDEVGQALPLAGLVLDAVLLATVDPCHLCAGGEGNGAVRFQHNRVARPGGVRLDVGLQSLHDLVVFCPRRLLVGAQEEQTRLCVDRFAARVVGFGLGKEGLQFANHGVPVTLTFSQDGQAVTGIGECGVHVQCLLEVGPGLLRLLAPTFERAVAIEEIEVIGIQVVGRLIVAFRRPQIVFVLEVEVAHDNVRPGIVGLQLHGAQQVLLGVPGLVEFHVGHGQVAVRTHVVRRMFQGLLEEGDGLLILAPVGQLAGAAQGVLGARTVQVARLRHGDGNQSVINGDVDRFPEGGVAVPDTGNRFVFREAGEVDGLVCIQDDVFEGNNNLIHRVLSGGV